MGTLRPPLSLNLGTSYIKPRSPIRSGCFNMPPLPARSTGSAQQSTSDPCRRTLKDFPIGKRSEKLKKGRCLRAIDSNINLTLGEDSQMADVVDTTRKFLVGRVRGRTYSVERLKRWTDEIWGSLLKELPVVRVLARGWFALQFHRPEYTQWILSQFWHIELALVLLKRWDPLFDPEREQLGAGPIWVHLPGLPMQFWTAQVFRRIGDALGTYLDHDKSYEQSRIMTMPRILVHLDTRPGLKEKITLHHRHFSRKQLLDYEGVPFCCRRCHKIGHLYKDCPLLSGVTSEDTKGPRPQPSVDLKDGESIPVEGELTQIVPPAKETPEGSKKTGTRRKASTSTAPPRTRSKTAEPTPTHSSNSSTHTCSHVLTDILHSVMHFPLGSSPLDHLPLPSISYSIAPPPHSFHHTPLT